ncbi:hypothetical protein [Dyella caseinilytica]|nr:hypothetical protein [Dyella caseinilytica]GGA00966.1 hypothetical protein GCM10011408_22590 [Dyella caseinilytica]
MKKCNARYMVYVAVTSMLAGAATLPSAFAASSSPDLEAQFHAAWRQTMQHTSAPAKGCYHASYPSTVWAKVDCVKAPNRLYLPRHKPEAQTVGNGNDYAAEISSGVISQTVGSFPSVSGVTSESDDGESNDYSLQLNSNFMSTDACNGVSGCQAWEQFVYASGEGEAFMQYWLINYGDTCPSGGWMSYQGSCYMNSAAVSVPDDDISDLGNMTLTGTAVAGGSDTLTFTDGTEAYTTSGDDSVVDLATAWQASEFNIIGDGGGSEADFNSGSSVTVNVSLTDGSSDAPTCASNAGTTGETNNLNLGSCSTSGGSTPSIQFTESN